MLLAALILALTPGTLPEVQERLEKERSAARQLAARESSLLGRLAELERQIEVESRALRAAQARHRSAAARLQIAEARVQEADQALAAKTPALGPRRPA